MKLLRNQKTNTMKKSLFILLLSLFFYPFITRAQNPGDLLVQIGSHQCDSSNYLQNAIGCDYWLSNSTGDTIYQDVVPSFTENWAFFVPYLSTEAPYYVNFDNTCLNSNGVTLNNYSLEVHNIHAVGNQFWADTVQVCESTQIADSVRAFVYSDCDSTSNLDLATGCDYWITNSDDSIVYQDNITSTFGYMEILFPYDATQYHYFINFDDSCLNASGVILDNYTFEITNIHPGSNEYEADSIKVCDNDTSNDSITYSALILAGNCDSIADPDVFLAAGCDYWVEDANGTIVFQNTITTAGSPLILGSLSFQYDDFIPPYQLRFDKDCINDKGLIFDNYTFPLNASDSSGGNIHDEIYICAHYDSTFVNDSCVDLFSNVGPWIGYYQNYTNYIRFEVGNNSSTPQSVTVEIVMPPGVTPVPSSFDFPYSVSGSLLTLSTTLPPYSNYFDIIKFNVPGAISNGTLHTYGISIYNNDSNAVDCALWNNQDTLHQVVGNSYDPNAKTVSLPEKISADTQDEFLYTIYFQNTGTAPAQDIYIIDTLSDNLDWSSFQFIRSSHVVGISDLGNGVKKFYFDGIWLPDSSTNFAESNGFVAFKIKEKPNNSAGTEVFNTGYIYFDQNAPIVTNTTYNINLDNLGLEDLANEVKVKLFPNPANESIKIEAENRIDRVDIYSVDGKLCWSSQPNESEVKLNISDFNSGLYLVRVRSQEVTKTLRFIKK